MELTMKDAKAYVKLRYRDAVCRFHWQYVNGVRREWYQVLTDRRDVSVRWQIGGSRSLSNNQPTKREAWIKAAQELDSESKVW